MADYKGNTCPVCKQKFKEADDIVVCPDCGTPYHRECWKKVGVCVHQADHAAGFEWQPEFGPDAEKAAHEATCPITVAQAAPAMPMPNVKMKSGSRMVLMTAPRSMHVIEKRGLPSARARLLRPFVRIRNGMPRAVIRV